MVTLAQQIKDVQREIGELEFKLAVSRQVLERLEVVNQNTTEPSNGKDRLVQGSLTSQMREVFAASKKPISTRELLTALEARGVTTNAKAGLKGAVASVLSKRDDLFVRVDRGTYDLKREPVESGHKE